MDVMSTEARAVIARFIREHLGQGSDLTPRPDMVISELLAELSETRVELEAARLGRGRAIGLAEQMGLIAQELLDTGHAVTAGMVVSRALVEKAHEVLNDGPGAVGVARCLALLREALS